MNDLDLGKDMPFGEETLFNRSKRVAVTIISVGLLFLAFKLYFPAAKEDRNADAALLLSNTRTKIVQPKAEEEPKVEQAKTVKPQAERETKIERVRTGPQRAKPDPFAEELLKRRLKGIWAPLTLGQQHPGQGAGGGPQTLEIPAQRQAAPHNPGLQTVWNRQLDQGEPGVLQAPLSPYTVDVGTVIKAKLVSPINTDVDGPVTARVIEPVYDATGRYLLIPYGSTLMGTVDRRRLYYSAERLPNAWHRLTLPNRYWMGLGSMPGANAAGVAGVDIETDNHYWGTLVRALGITLAGGLGQLATQNSYNGGDLNPEDAFANEAGRELRSTGRSTFSPGLHRPPTGTAAAGGVVLVQVVQPLQFPGPYQDTDYAYSEE